MKKIVKLLCLLPLILLPLGCGSSEEPSRSDASTNIEEKTETEDKLLIEDVINNSSNKLRAKLFKLYKSNPINTKIIPEDAYLNISYSDNKLTGLAFRFIESTTKGLKHNIVNVDLKAPLDINDLMKDNTENIFLSGHVSAIPTGPEIKELTSLKDKYIKDNNITNLIEAYIVPGKTNNDGTKQYGLFLHLEDKSLYHFFKFQESLSNEEILSKYDSNELEWLDPTEITLPSVYLEIK